MSVGPSSSITQRWIYPLPRPVASPIQRFRINFSWLLRLRWAAIGGQLATIITVAFLIGIEIRLAMLFGIVAAEIAINTFFVLWFQRQKRLGAWSHWNHDPDRVLGSVMMLDIVFLTGLLYASGGPTNPFSIFYLVNITLGAVVLSARRAWVVGALAIGAYLVLYVDHLPVPALGNVWMDRGGGLQIHSSASPNVVLAGMAVALTTASAFIIYFVTRLTLELTRLETELLDALARKAKGEKLEALATLAAGAAHELASPLSTIAVIARELELELERSQIFEAAVADAKLIRREVDRCREILDQMAVRAGESAGEEMTRVTCEEFIDGALAKLPDRELLDLQIEPAAGQAPIRIARLALGQTLRALIKNGRDASPSDSRVAVRVSSLPGRVRIEVHDQGRGMAEEVLERAGEPFFTTKEPGQGMGLGLFLSRTVVERLGGTLDLHSEPWRGTVATIELPILPADPADPASTPDAPTVASGTSPSAADLSHPTPPAPG